MNTTGISLSTQVFLQMATPILTSILKDLLGSFLNEGTVLEARRKMKEVLNEMTAKIPGTWDDRIIEYALSRLSDPAFVQEWGAKILNPMIAFIAASETKWDDRLILPAIEQFARVMGITLESAE